MSSESLGTIELSEEELNLLRSISDDEPRKLELQKILGNKVIELKEKKNS